MIVSAGCIATAAATTVYKWVDENGVLHYSDQPHEHAEKVELKAPQTYTPTKSRDVGSVSQPREPADNGPIYKSCDFSQPVPDQVFMNTFTVTAGITLSPQARQGDTVVVTLDGQRVPGVPADGGSFTISPVDRGTHSLQATVQDSQGHPVCQSQSVTFHVHQPSLLNPQSPVHPKG